MSDFPSNVLSTERKNFLNYLKDNPQTWMRTRNFARNNMNLEGMPAEFAILNSAITPKHSTFTIKPATLQRYGLLKDTYSKLSPEYTQNDFKNYDRFLRDLYSGNTTSKLAAENGGTNLIKNIQNYTNDIPNTQEQLADNIAYKSNNLKNWICNNQAQAAGYGITGAVNIGGLFDNDKILGQLGGAAGGYGITKIPAVSAFLESKGINPTLVAMSGGALGSLFDKLRAKEEREKQSYY